MPSRTCKRTLIPRPIIAKLQKNKDKILKAPRGGKKDGVTLKAAVVGLTADFFAVTAKATDLPRILKPSKKYL